MDLVPKRSGTKNFPKIPKPIYVPPVRNIVKVNKNIKGLRLLLFAPSLWETIGTINGNSKEPVKKTILPTKLKIPY